jgi:outer membrane receptor protein involved in Fe transport
VYRDNRNTYGTISRTNLVAPVPAFVETTLAGAQRPMGSGGNVRTEYRLNERDALTFDSYLYGGRFEGRNSSYYTNLDQSRVVTGAFNQFNRNASTYLSQDYDFAFRRQGKPNTQQITAEVEYSSSYNRNTTNLSGALLKADASTPGAIPTERDRSTGNYPTVNAKLDYSIPIKPASKLETGLKATWRRTSSDFTAAYEDEVTGEMEVNPSRTTGIDYHENIVGGYALYSQRIARVQLQTGLRLENANTDFSVPSVSRNFEKTYHSFYPSMVLSYNFTDLRQAKLSYSRRVSRPNPYQLNPIEYKQDDRHLFRGNPGLGAEYTNSYDLSLQE